jgi:hypothetical protein
METKHDINVEIPQKSPDQNLVITNDVNLGFNNQAQEARFARALCAARR